MRRTLLARKNVRFVNLRAKFLYSWCLLKLATWLLYTIKLPTQAVSSAAVHRQYLATAPSDKKMIPTAVPGDKSCS